MPRSSASLSSGVNSFSMAMQPLTWNPPIATGTPRARNWRAIAMARKLIRLNAYKADDAGMARTPYALCNSLNGDLDVHVIVGVHRDRDVLAQHFPTRAILGNGVKGGHGIGRNPGLPPLNDVAVLVIVRRLYDLDMKCLHDSGPSPARRNPRSLRVAGSLASSGAAVNLPSQQIKTSRSRLS